MKKILLTGATDGIGFETAKVLASQGHHLLIHGRSERKLFETEAVLKKEFPGITVESYCADLSDFSAIQTMLKAIAKAHTSLDVLINNAGVFKTPNAITADGLDSRFVVNTFAPYIITRSLLPKLSNTGRIVNLSSAAQAPVNLAALKGSQLFSDAFQAYAQSKLAITAWTLELASQLQPAQVAIAVNPGSMLASKMVKEGFGVAGNDLSIGADILVRAALSEAFEGASGQYYDNDVKQFSAPHPDAANEDKRRQIVAAVDEILQPFFGG